jgi:hypothetical protein
MNPSTVKTLRLDVAARIAKALGVTLDQLAEADEKAAPAKPSGVKKGGGK